MDNDSVTLNELTPKLVNILTRYLQIRFGASIEDAEDCVQTVLLRGLSASKKTELKNQNLFWRISLPRLGTNTLGLKRQRIRRMYHL